MKILKENFLLASEEMKLTEIFKVTSQGLKKQFFVLRLHENFFEREAVLERRWIRVFHSSSFCIENGRKIPIKTLFLKFSEKLH